MLLAEYRVSERRACAIVFLQRSVYRYLDQPHDDGAVRQRMKEIAETRVRYGFARTHILLGYCPLHSLHHAFSHRTLKLKSSLLPKRRRAISLQ